MSVLKIISSATSDLYSDQRIDRVCNTLAEMNFEVLSVGRKKKESPPFRSGKYKAKRLRLIFEKGPFFYAEYNFRLFLLLFFSRADILLANDLDVLPANALASFLKRIPLVYDSHEYFTEVPELQHRPVVRGAWRWLEKICIKRVQKAYTVSDSIAEAYHKQYGISFGTVRNLPYKAIGWPAEDENPFEKQGNEKIILYQGSVNVDRGLEEMISAMKHIHNAILWIVGVGDVLAELKKLVATLELQKKVRFEGRVSFQELRKYTRHADVGISIEKAVGLSYTFALPNKVFDYVQAGIPSVISPLPEMIRLNEEYGFGAVIPNHDEFELSKTFNELLSDENKMNLLRDNAVKAAEDLNWDKEQEIIKQIYSDFVDRA